MLEIEDRPKDLVLGENRREWTLRNLALCTGHMTGLLHRIQDDEELQLFLKDRCVTMADVSTLSENLKKLTSAFYQK